MAIVNTPHAPLTAGIKHKLTGKKAKTYDSGGLAAMFANLYGGQRQSFALGEQEIRGGFAGIDKDQANATANARFAASFQREGMLGQQQQALGATQQGNINSGMGGTSVGTNRLRSVYQAGSAGLGAVDQDLATVLANINVGAGGARMDAYQQLAQLLEAKQASLVGIGELKSQALRSGWTGNAKGLPGLNQYGQVSGTNKTFLQKYGAQGSS